MSDEIVDNLKKPSAWLRVLFMAGFVVALYVTGVVLLVIMLAQIIFSLLTGGDNSNLRRMGAGLSTYVSQILAYLTYNSEQRPFPFSNFPQQSASDENPAPEPGAEPEPEPEPGPEPGPESEPETRLDSEETKPEPAPTPTTTPESPPTPEPEPKPAAQAAESDAVKEESKAGATRKKPAAAKKTTTANKSATKKKSTTTRKPAARKPRTISKSAKTEGDGDS